MKFSFNKVHTTIRLTVVAVFLLATTLTAGLAIGLQYYFGQTMARSAAAELYTAASSGIAAELRSIGEVNANIIDLLADNLTLTDPQQEAAHLESFIRILEKNPLYYGVYLGRSDGSFFEVINLDASDRARRALRALPSDRWLIVDITEGADGRERRYRYLDKDLRSRLARKEPTDYAVATRSWFIRAMDSWQFQRSAPYLFAQLGVPGRTLSKRIAGSETVVALDMTLDSISEKLRDNNLAEDGEIYLYHRKGEIVASSLDYQYAKPDMPIPDLQLSAEEIAFVKSLPKLRVSNELNWPPFDYAQSGKPRGYSIDVIRLIAEMTGIKVEYVNGYSWNELVDMFTRGELDLLHSVVRTENNEDLGLHGSSYAQLPFALVTREGAAPVSSLAAMNGKRLAIPQGWSVIPIVLERFPDIDVVEVESTVQAIEQTLAGDVDGALDNAIIMRYIARHYFLSGIQYHNDLDLGQGPVPDKLHIVVKPGQEMLRKILDKAIAALGPDQIRYLETAWLDFEAAEQVIDSSTVPTSKFIEIASDPSLFSQLFEIDMDGEAQLIYVAPTWNVPKENDALFVGIITPIDIVLAPYMEKIKLSVIITAIFMLLLLPFSWLFANPIVRPIKQLAYENNKVRRRQYDEVSPVSSHVKELAELSESMVSMVKAIQAHELAQRQLMDSFIQLIAQAIDDKSAYTGGHCERVPELALMLADHASRSDLPAFRDFDLTSDDEWREYRIAAWLHDCGKITTPEHIVDKGSKLETIYNRIHEVRMRFEVLWRDAEISYWEQLAESPNEQTRCQEELEQAQLKLRDDFEFVAECNVGGEFLDETKQDRLKAIAQTRWQRQFDDRIGLSPIEELRTPPVEPELPATEYLLSDKPEHIIERTRSTDYPPEFGINMDVPEHLYNLGEIYNLSISRGTLTAEDRFKINEHMISTIKMLESLPFPEELKNVPRYASTHHETMRGSGYPRKLRGEQLSIPERILAVADVFEALTASDRPYKKAKPVSVAVDILHKMVLDNHIDRDCFELFIRDKVYQQYAEQYLSPNQVDAVDITKYVQDMA